MTIPFQPLETKEKISLKSFLEEYSGKEDGYQYEWNNGTIEKTQAMN